MNGGAEPIRQFAAIMTNGIEAVMILVIALGTIRALLSVAQCLFKGDALGPNVRRIWLHYAAWILLALEFALAADLIETVMAPGWTEIGQLAAIAAVRTGLAWFLGRDIRDFEDEAPKAAK